MDAYMLRKGALVLVALLFAGCGTLQPPLPPPVEEPIEIVVAEPPVDEVQPLPEPEVQEPPPPLPFVSIVLTNSQPAYADVAQELTRHFDNYEIYDLDKDDRPPVTILRVINDSNPGAVVAIGLRAARSSVAIPAAAEQQPRGGRVATGRCANRCVEGGRSVSQAHRSHYWRGS
jgi:hypothetical protein